MCSYITVKAPVTGSGKGARGWFSLSHASVYFDHPYHSPLEHTLNIDFIDESAGADARVAVELSAESARRLVDSIEAALRAGDAAHVSTMAVASKPESRFITDEESNGRTTNSVTQTDPIE